MPYDRQLADRVRVLLGPRGAQEKRMFGGLAFLLEGRMAVAVSGRGGLMVRCDPGEADDLLAHDDVAPVVMRGRPARGWVRVTAAALASDADLAEWVERGASAAG